MSAAVHAFLAVEAFKVLRGAVRREVHTDVCSLVVCMYVCYVAVQPRAATKDTDPWVVDQERRSCLPVRKVRHPRRCEFPIRLTDEQQAVAHLLHQPGEQVVGPSGQGPSPPAIRPLFGHGPHRPCRARSAVRL